MVCSNFLLIPELATNHIHYFPLIKEVLLLVKNVLYNKRNSQ